ncbi:unnamed protein product (mitochondrion) [Plasmodiophora brassicae]|uniref:Uncharacterized protein n=1 Tax=Plasmodiophora brassicae TaxID=37360 RepID=A0A0G4IP88_PLABS|nr:hypothetical protein PBRA_005609 [Plasmodiophora brassicae]SPR00984.1 unnamed protein product [Plasmodiophora brassicae]
MLRMLLLAAVAVVSLVAAQDLRAAVVFTDVKLDDKVAVNYLRYSGDYYLVIVVITCVADVQRAHGDLRDFLDKVAERKGSSSASSAPAEVFVMSVANPKHKAVRHEKNFLGNGIETLPFDHIDDWFQEPTVVDIFQIAPTPMDNIVRVSNARNVHVGLYHLSFGYCSSQYDAFGNSDPNAQKVFVTSIGDEIRSQHPNAIVVFCSNKQSFNPPGSGSYQPYATMKDLLPEDHLEADLKETFLADKVLEAGQVLQYWGVPIRTPLFPSIPEYKTKKELHDLFLMTRKNDPSTTGSGLREHFRAYLEEAIPKLDELSYWKRLDTNLLRRLRQDVRPVFDDDAEMQILISDGNQVAAVIDAVYQNSGTLKNMRLVGNDRDMVYELAPSEEDTDDKMIYGASRERCLDLLRPTLQ